MEIAYGSGLGRRLPMRYAIYFTPAKDEPADADRRQLARPRPVQRRRQVPPPSVAGLTPAEIAFHTASARRYGFHATLKAPFLLAAERDRSLAARRPSTDFAADAEPFDHPASCRQPDRRLLRAGAGSHRLPGSTASPMMSC